MLTGHRWVTADNRMSFEVVSQSPHSLSCELKTPDFPEAFRYYSFVVLQDPDPSKHRILINGMGFSQNETSAQHGNLQKTDSVLNVYGIWPNPQGVFSRMNVQATMVRDIPGHGCEVAVLADEPFLLT